MSEKDQSSKEAKNSSVVGAPIGPEDTNFDIMRIMKILPHRYPFLLVDKVLDVEYGPNPKSRTGRTFRGIKCVTFNEQFFSGHFPGLPVMPGVLIVESMAQAAAVACYLPAAYEKTEVAIAGIKEAKFRRPVVPGDVLEIRGKCVRDGGTMLSVSCECFVDGQPVASATLLAKMTGAGGVFK